MSSIIAALMRMVPMRDCWRATCFLGGACALGLVSSGVEQGVAVWELSSRLGLDTGRTVLLVTPFKAANVVPRLVDDRAAPAANASRGL